MENNIYYQKFINFLKEHYLYDEKILEYWKNNRTLFDYRDEEKRDLMGCFYQYEKEYLTKIHLIVPFIDNDKTVLINIHEYIHLLTLYNKIGKKCKIGDDKEVLPFLYERIFINENKTDELLKYYQYLNQSIIESNVNEYLIALHLSEILLEEYDNDAIHKLDKRAKKLTKKYKKNPIHVS